MPLFGAHLSIAGSFTKAIDAAEALECEALQIFTKAPGQWRAKPITDVEAERFKTRWKASRIQRIIVHDSYLINLGSPDQTLFDKSVAAFVEEINRCHQLGITDLVSHPGAHLGSGEEAGLQRVASGLEQALRLTEGLPVRILLETTAGQGSSLGAAFEHLGTLLRTVPFPDRLGVCLDTCHILAAGYPLDPQPAYDATWAAFEHHVGIQYLHAFHLNDSVKPQGSRVDRHAGLGLGHVGLAAFERIVGDPRFRELPMILETPKEDDSGTAMDPVNLGILRQMLATAKSASVASDPQRPPIHEQARDRKRSRPRNP